MPAGLRKSCLIISDDSRDAGSPVPFKVKMDAFDGQGQSMASAVAAQPTRGATRGDTLVGIPEFELKLAASLAAQGADAGQGQVVVVAVPNVVGMTRDEAVKKLADVGLAAGAIAGDASGKVSSQTPAANTQVAKASGVSITITAERCGPCHGVGTIRTPRTCGPCVGSGKMPCGQCGGDGKVGPGNGMKCLACSGSGKVMCVACAGGGRTPGAYDDLRCQACGGTGMAK